MGCGTSTTTVVEPIHCDELTKDEDETGSKLGSRGDSAVSKVTADSGVVMESSQDPSLPGAVPRKIPPLTGSPGLFQDQGSPVERPRSSEILEQLLSQGIIPAGPPRERSSGPGEVYSLMLNDGELPRQRPPARLESLKERKEQSSPSRDSINHKMQQAEERHQQNEEELETSLRTKSARVRAPSTVLAESEDPDPQEDQPLQTPITTITPDPQAHTQVREDGRGATERSVRGSRESPGEGREEGGGEEDEKKDEGGEGVPPSHQGRDEEEKEAREEEMLGGCGEREGGNGGPVQDEGLQVGQFLTTSGEFESDPSFQNTDDTF
ncbi:unnamed protein product [Lota lota]